MIKSFIEAAPVLERLIHAGYEAYFVGGSVRDYLLDKPISDVDIATSATPSEIKAVFSKTVDIGIEHGTILVLYKNNSYEITTFRSEAEYEDFRRPKEVKFIRSLKEDLQRRDFTMNAIAMDREGLIIDPFGGKKSIVEKSIQTVGQADDRFREDALRMMRAVRFVSQLSFTIEEDTFQALIKNRQLLEKIATERKRAEFEKLLTGQDRRKALKLLLNAGIYKYLPAMEMHEMSLSRLFQVNCDFLTLNEMWALILYCLEHKDKKSAESFLREWKLPVKQIKDIQSIHYYFTERFNSTWHKYDLYLAGKETILSSQRVFEAVAGKEEPSLKEHFSRMYDKLPIKNRADLAVTGSELMSWFNRDGGPWVKEAMESIERAVLEEKVRNSTAEIKEWLLNCSQS
ncbi:CCA tRNA nucleotidyltransferase [Neobacillus sp. PS3-34]|uniref:CCA tRNA nucleotidyltransferase n=1 Tax=Neobacillus sp. PS3-34 TaxID=3070678 RepID=UPI0027E103C6|nr:CCA tRNA nucleotidyltransferase [Neobacillus sp. PS3-34]WML47712.1 CCA tRNA nucleotidyltransferase [Neobacillus sp. PS3-34]